MDKPDSLAKPCPEGTEGPYYVRERERAHLFFEANASEVNPKLAVILDG